MTLTIIQSHFSGRLPRSPGAEATERRPRPLRRPRDEAVPNPGRDGGGPQEQPGHRRSCLRAEVALRNGAGGERMTERLLKLHSVSVLGDTGQFHGSSESILNVQSLANRLTVCCETYL